MSAKLRAFALLLLPALTACEWFTDFKRQPSIWTWEQVRDSTVASRGNPQFSVPTTGTAMAGYQVSYGALPATLDSLAGVPNPSPSNAASLANGRKHFQINCAVCHGDRATGDGPATKFGMPGINLVMDITKSRSDGYIYGMIRNGRGLMPPYNRIEEPDRWDIVNYLRALQGANGASVEAGPLAAPGVTGDKVPGPSRLGPTRPAPFFNPRDVLARGAHAAPPSAEAATQQGLAVPADSAAIRNPAITPADTTGNAAKRAADSVKRQDSIRAQVIR